MTQDAKASGWQMCQADPSRFLSARYPLTTFTIQTGPSCFGDRHSFVNEAMKGTIPQGGLFAYLFRRFGYPLHAWDAHKHLVTYWLTTPRDDMMMRISPCAEGVPELGISFGVPPEVLTRIDAYPMRPIQAHRSAFGAWVEANGLAPFWAQAWMDALRNRQTAVSLSAVPPSWADTLQYLRYLHLAEPGSEEQHWYDWYSRTWALYCDASPVPPEDFRSADWTTWSDEDPLKPYLEAALRALADLHVPVWHRDIPITPWGMATDAEDDIEDAAKGADYHAVAGYPSGALGTHAPQDFDDLQRLILTLGRTPEEAIAKAWTILTKAKEGQ